MGGQARTKALQRAVGQLHGQRAVLEAQQHFQRGARGAGRVTGNDKRLGH